MNLKISYRHMDRTDAIEAKITEKLEHLAHHFKESMDVEWVCTIDGDIHRSDVNITVGKDHFHAHAEDANLYKTFDMVMTKLKNQIQKSNYHGKNKAKVHTVDKDARQFYNV